jgi:hypothetical protein
MKIHPKKGGLYRATALRKDSRPADGAAPSWGGSILALSILNFVVFALVSGYLGGDALGTIPVRGNFFLEAHGKQTIVSEATWVFSLFYSWASLVLPFLAILASVAPLHRRGSDSHAVKGGLSLRSPLIRLLLSLLALGWIALVTKSAARSLLAWLESAR